MMDSSKRQDGISGSRLFILFLSIKAIYRLRIHSYHEPNLHIGKSIGIFDSIKKELIVDSKQDLKDEIAIVAYKIYEQKGILS